MNFAMNILVSMNCYDHAYLLNKILAQKFTFVSYNEILINWNVLEMRKKRNNDKLFDE